MDETTIEQTKRCSKCREVKGVTAFSNNGGGHLRSACKACRARQGREARAAGDIRNILTSMVQRCYNTKHPRYPLYGARGISVCDRWRKSPSTFISDMGPRPSKKHSVDRVDVDGDYDPSNCRWATQTEQMQNTRRNVRIEAFGESLLASEWAERFGLNPDIIGQRINVLGWSPDRAVSTPSQRRKS